VADAQNVMPLPQQAPRFQPVVDAPAGPAEHDLTPSLIDMARAISAICASRLLLLLAVLIAAPIWWYAVYEPTNLRIVAATAYAVVTVFPLTALYWRRG
jgi:hypothetical protein